MKKEYEVHETAIIDKGANVAAGSVVRKDVKLFELVVGVPANRIGWVDELGNRQDMPS